MSALEMTSILSGCEIKSVPGGQSFEPRAVATAGTRDGAFESDTTAAQQVWHASRHDPLTGLANRVLLTERIGGALGSARPAGHFTALMILGIDQFNNINDSLGTDVGDWFLRKAATRLRQAVDPASTVARIGGDEFAILLPSLPNKDDALGAAGRMLRALTAPLATGDDSLLATASLGISFHPDHGNDGATLLRHADIAMRRAKADGGNAVRVYEPFMTTGAARVFSLNQRLRSLVPDHELSLHYQPIVTLGDMSVHSMEALLRWQLPSGARVSPAEFIPLAETSGTILRIGGWTIQCACEQIRSWRDAGHQTVPVAINLSPRQFSQPDLVDAVLSAIYEAGLEPDCLELEITETALMRDVDDALPKLHRLADQGVRLAIDDFGTGYSSLSRLQKLPVDTLKIDQTFVRGLIDDPANVAIIASIVTLAKGLGMSIVAEGVETVEQLSMLTNLGCDRCQGYFYSRPLEAIRAHKWLQRRLSGEHA